MTQDTDKTVEPDWKKIAYELASLLDDIDLQFQSDMYLERGDSRNIYIESPRSKFLIKKFIAAQKYFRRYRNELLYIDDYNKQKDQDEKLRIDMFNPS